MSKSTVKKTKRNSRKKFTPNQINAYLGKKFRLQNMILFQGQCDVNAKMSKLNLVKFDTFPKENKPEISV